MTLMAETATQPDQSTPIDELTPEEASRIIQSRRKVRYGKPDRCLATKNASSVDAGQSRKRTRSSPDAPEELARESEHGDGWPRTMGTFSLIVNTLGFRLFIYALVPWSNALRAELPTSVDDSESVESVGDRYLGQNSIPALLREQSSPNEENDSVDIRRDLRSILGLDTSAPFPLMSSHHLQRLAHDISAELPSDREVLKYVTCPCTCPSLGRCVAD
ncbi:hypothetical protein UVI_02061410 [Ustilaginoidea virens]|uniref:Uncharacterized protein n=1 Tax=Ustilaginoidea virens TaxID=1159556 RepID=A0A1B5L6H2_USTVR|nr:hypothetical protein UVI_02061410 [Ustilaginoidea virens]